VWLEAHRDGGTALRGCGCANIRFAEEYIEVVRSKDARSTPTPLVALPWGYAVDEQRAPLGDGETAARFTAVVVCLPALLICDRDDAGHGCLSFGVYGDSRTSRRSARGREGLMSVEPAFELLALPALGEIVAKERQPRPEVRDPEAAT